MVKAAYDKMPDVHWASYRALYGQEGNTYIVFTAMKSAAEIDQSFTQDKQFMANMGEDGMKKFSELLAAAIETSQHNLFAFSPSMSYPRDEWIKADPDFWKPKAHAAAASEKSRRKAGAVIRSRENNRGRRSGGLFAWMEDGVPPVPHKRLRQTGGTLVLHRTD